MTTFLILDTETTGLDPAHDQLIEVGAALYDADVGALIACRSEIIEATSNAAAAVNGIPEALVREGHSLRHVVDWLDVWTYGADYAVAHNAAFDRQWLPTIEERLRWICTYRDADWTHPLPPAGSGSLTALALAHGVGVVRAHRAIEDVLTLAAILTRVHELEGGLGAWLDRALEPRVEVIARVSYDDRDLAKRAGFAWDADRKIWVRSVRESQLESERREWPFAVAETR